MGHKTTTHSGDLLDLELNAIPIKGLAQPTQLSKVLYLSLHSADPGATGDQNTSEIKYVGYQRLAIPRDSSKPRWKRDGASFTNAEVIAFPMCEGGHARATWFGLGTDRDGKGRLLRRGMISTAFTVESNIVPQAKPGAITIEES